MSIRMAIWRRGRSVALALVVLVGSSVMAPEHLPATEASGPGPSAVDGLHPTGAPASPTPAIS
ncbi:MAG: hypothetical protein ACXWWR_07210, partial [Candidatus Limnocylindrales bacterium]